MHQVLQHLLVASSLTMLAAACSQGAQQGAQSSASDGAGQAAKSVNSEPASAAANGDGKVAATAATPANQSATPSATPVAGVETPFTPVLLILGGYTSCLASGGGPDSPKNQKMYLQLPTILDGVKKAAKVDPVYLLGCYSLDNSKIVYFTSASPGVVAAPVATMVDDFAAFVASVPNPKIFAIGHSYGGWTAMDTLLTLRTTAPIGGLITLDPISMVDCSPQTFIGGALGGSAGGCQRAPTDFGDSSLMGLAKSVGFWANFYETGSANLHSGPLADATVNTDQGYTGNGFDAHNMFTRDAALFVKITGLIAATFGKQP